MKVGKLSYGQQSETVEQAIISDIMDTIRDWLTVLMENYKVCYYNYIRNVFPRHTYVSVLFNYVWDS